MQMTEFQSESERRLVNIFYVEMSLMILGI